jgi:SET domain-containing protein
MPASPASEKSSSESRSGSRSRSEGRRAPKVASIERAAVKAAANPAFVVRRSRIQGRGVFAARAIKKGEMIVEYIGKRMTHEAASLRYDDESARRHHTFLFTVDDDLCIDGGREGNEARLINHSCDPNAFAEIENRRIFIRSLRPIVEGEEIVYDYWYSTDESYTLDDLRRIYPCRCGSEKCRGTLAAPPPKKPRAKAATNGKKARRNGSR